MFDSIRFGISTYSQPVEYPLGKGHLLIGGTTGSGKSGVLNSFIYHGAFNPYCQFVGFDPKLVELSIWEKRFAILCENNNQIELSLNFLNDVMDLRYQLMKSKKIRGWSTDLGSWIIVIVDELAEVMAVDLSQGDDKTSKQKRANRQAGLERIARLGRAAGIFLVSCTQRPSQAVLPEQYRDQHAFRLCLAVRETETGKMVLGSRIPGYDPSDLGFDTPGRGYLLEDKSLNPIEMRAYFVTEDMAEDTAIATAHFVQPIPDKIRADLEQARNRREAA